MTERGQMNHLAINLSNRGQVLEALALQSDAPEERWKESKDAYLKALTMRREQPASERGIAITSAYLARMLTGKRDTSCRDPIAEALSWFEANPKNEPWRRHHAKAIQVLCNALQLNNAEWSEQIFESALESLDEEMVSSRYREELEELKRRVIDDSP